MKRTLTILASLSIAILASTASADTHIWVTTEGAGFEMTSHDGHCMPLPPPPPCYNHQHHDRRHCKECQKYNKELKKAEKKYQKEAKKAQKKHHKKHRH